tara:strand:+ start:21340 stop:21585 length:246 start_codon:yes stop_codon:yes gene_type:complete
LYHAINCHQYGRSTDTLPDISKPDASPLHLTLIAPNNIFIMRNKMVRFQGIIAKLLFLRRFQGSGHHENNQQSALDEKAPE